MLRISDIYGSEEREKQKVSKSIKQSIHVCLPCVVQSYNISQRTVDVQPTIREKITNEDGRIEYAKYPLLINVPIVFPQSGNFYISFPINLGDECIVVFSDLSIDNWWVNGGVQNPVENRRHDLSDGIAIFGIRNKNRYSNSISNNSLILKNEKSGVGIEIDENDIKITAKVQRSGGESIETRTVSEIFSTLFPE